MDTWALVIVIVGAVTGLIGGVAGVYSIVISHRALGFEKKKYEESKLVKLRVELRHDLQVEPPEENNDEVRLVSVVTMRAYNEGAMPIRLTQGWFQVGPERKGLPALSEYFNPDSYLTVEPNDSQKVECRCVDLARRAHGMGLEGEVEINGYFYDSLRNVYRNDEPYCLQVDMFYKNGEYVEDPLTYAESVKCPDCGYTRILCPPVVEIVKRKQEKSRSQQADLEEDDEYDE